MDDDAIAAFTPAPNLCGAVAIPTTRPNVSSTGPPLALSAIGIDSSRIFPLGTARTPFTVPSVSASAPLASGPSAKTLSPAFGSSCASASVFASLPTMLNRQRSSSSSTIWSSAEIVVAPCWKTGFVPAVRPWHVVTTVPASSDVATPSGTAAPDML